MTKKPNTSERQRWDRKFAEVDLANPEIWRLFQLFALDRIEKGFKHYSAGAVLHRVRWETTSVMADKSEFKINDRWTSYWARKFALKYPQHATFFFFRAAKADLEMETIRELAQAEGVAE